MDISRLLNSPSPPPQSQPASSSATAPPPVPRQFTHPTVLRSYGEDGLSENAHRILNGLSENPELGQKGEEHKALANMIKSALIEGNLKLLEGTPEDAVHSHIYDDGKGCSYELTVVTTLNESGQRDLLEASARGKEENISFVVPQKPSSPRPSLHARPSFLPSGSPGAPSSIRMPVTFSPSSLSNRAVTLKRDRGEFGSTQIPVTFKDGNTEWMFLSVASKITDSVISHPKKPSTFITGKQLYGVITSNEHSRRKLKQGAAGLNQDLRKNPLFNEKVEITINEAKTTVSMSELNRKPLKDQQITATINGKTTTAGGSAQYQRYRRSIIDSEKSALQTTPQQCTTRPASGTHGT